MNNYKTYSGGGDKEVESMIGTSALLGVDLIEVMWIPRTGNPRWAVAKIAGFLFPIVRNVDPTKEDITADSWIDGTLKFYPDPNGRCWGYIYDCPENREKIYNSMSTGWFRVVDKKLRDELIEEAKAKGIKTDRNIRSQSITKKSRTEKEAEDKAKSLETKLFHMEEQMKKYQKELEEAKNIRQVKIEERIKGISIPDSKEVINLIKG